MIRLVCCLIIFISCGKYAGMNTSKVDIDKIFKAWNVQTSNSINFQITSAVDKQQKLLYENRLEAFKSYLEISNFNVINTESIRYKFLQECIKDWSDKFYIIEANVSGEQVSIVSYILKPNKNNTSKIYKYEYKNGDWMKISEYLMDRSFELDRKKYSTIFGKGTNQDDVIVTSIENNNIISSDFYLFSTMKPDSAEVMW